MSEPGKETVAISGRDMVEFRRAALEIAIKALPTQSPVAQIAHVGGQFLGLLMGLQPVGVEAIVTDPQPNAGAAEAQKVKAERKQRATPVDTATVPAGSTATAPSAPAAVATGPSEPAKPTTPAAATAPTAQSAPVAGSPTLVSPPTDLNSAAIVLKEAVGDLARGRDFVKSLLAKYGVELMSQIAAPKLADFVKDLKAGKAALATVDANDPLKGLI